MTRRLNIVLALLLLLVGGPAWYLLIDSSPWSVEPKPLDIDGARRLSEAMPGPRPERVEYAVLASRGVPGNIFAAGSGFKNRKLGVLVFRLAVPGRPAILIDSGVTETYAAKIGFGAVSLAERNIIDQAMREAGLLLVTHEHGDHLGGLADLLRRENRPDLAAKAQLNRFQVPGSRPQEGVTWPQGLTIRPTIDDTKAQAIAPGVVTIPAPGHTPGSQMIFVKLADGSEFLFAGDTAPMASSWSEVRPPSRLISDFWTPEDRPAVIGWLKAINLAKQKSPGLIVIPGHDLEWLADPLNRVPVTRMVSASRQKQAGN